MTQLIDRLNTLHRPRLLIQAARIGAATYLREVHLRRLFEPGSVPGPTAALAALLDMEEAMNDERKAGDAAYCAADHVDLLIALMGEGRILRAALRDATEPKVVPLKSRSGSV